MREFNEVEALRTFKKESGWSYEKMGREIGVHSQAIQAWFKGTKPNNLSRKAIRAFLIEHPLG